MGANINLTGVPVACLASEILPKEVSLVSQSKEIVQAKRMLLALVAQKKAAALANSK